MMIRIEPPMTHKRNGGPEAHIPSLGTEHIPSLGPVAANVPDEVSETSEYIKYPHAEKAVFALAVATVVFAIVQSSAILIVTAWLLWVRYIMSKGMPDTGYTHYKFSTDSYINMHWEEKCDHEYENISRLNNMDNGYHGGTNIGSILRYENPFDQN